MQIAGVLMKPAALRKRWLAVGVVLLACTIFGLLCWRGRGPRYEGRSASYWVGQLLHDYAKARQALRQFGPNAVPALTDVVNKRRSPFWTWIEAWRPKLPAFIGRRLPNRALDQLLQERAIEVLYEFGPASAPAASALLGVDASLNDFVGFGSAGLAHATLLRIGPAGLPYFVKALRNTNPKIRARAASYLGHLGPEGGAAAPALATALDDSVPAVRSAAVVALGQIGPAARAAIPDLTAALHLDDDYLRLQVIRALWKVSHESETCVPILMKILGDRNNPNRAGAAILLGEMGPAAKEATPALTNVLREEFSYTRVKAEEALKQIEGRPAAQTSP